MAPKPRDSTPGTSFDDDDDESLSFDDDDDDEDDSGSVTATESEDSPKPTPKPAAAAAATAAPKAAPLAATKPPAATKPSSSGGTSSPLTESSGFTLSTSEESEATTSTSTLPPAPAKPTAASPAKPAIAGAATTSRAMPSSSGDGSSLMSGDSTGFSSGTASSSATMTPSTSIKTPAASAPATKPSTTPAAPASSPSPVAKGVALTVDNGAAKSNKGPPLLTSMMSHTSTANTPLTPSGLSVTAQAAGLSGGPDPGTGLELPTPLQLFLHYDKDKSRAVGRDEFKQMLFDLDGLQGVDQKDVDAYTHREFEKADLNHDGIISIDEFYYYFYRELCFKFPVLRTGVNPGADLFNIFTKYCSAGKPVRCVEMYSHQFAKLIKASKLMCDKVNKADVDILFTRAKAETEVLEDHVQKQKAGGHARYTTASISYPQFLFALLKLAEKRRTGFQEVVSHIMANVSAIPKPSQADLLIFRTTGTPEQLVEWIERPRGLPKLPRVMNDNAQRMQLEADLAQQLKLPGPKKQPPAGPEAVAPGAPAVPAAGSSAAPPAATAGGTDLPTVNANLADTETRRKWGLEEYGSPEQLGLPCTGKAALCSPAALMAVRKLDHDHLMMALKRTFERYNLWERGVSKSAMDKIRFAKSMRDAGLVFEQGPLTAAAADAVFGKVLAPGNTHVNFIEYIEALRHVATRMRTSLNEVMERVVLVSAPLAQ